MLVSAEEEWGENGEKKEVSNHDEVAPTAGKVVFTNAQMN